MGGMLVRRLALLVPMLLGITFIAFMLGELSPSDPAEVSIRVNAMVPTPELIAQTRHELGLDRPLMTRYFEWLAGVLQGDLGTSFVTGHKVTDDFLRAFPPTLALAGATLLIVLVTGGVCGWLCARHAGGPVDRAIRSVLFTISALPNFWAALLLMWLFSPTLGWLPTNGMRTPESVILPAVSLSLAYVGTYVRLIRTEMLRTAESDWVMFARARGLSEGRISLHMMLNSLRGTVTALGMSIPKLVAGTFVIENIFAWPGIGRLCVSAIFNRDLPVIIAYVLVMAVFFILFNLLSDLALAALDPRARRGGAGEAA